MMVNIGTTAVTLHHLLSGGEPAAAGKEHCIPDLCISGRNLTKSSWLRGSLMETMIVDIDDH